jgi:hypothetical protein
LELAAAELLSLGNDSPSGLVPHSGNMHDFCNALNLGVDFFLLFSHQIQALLFPFSLFFSPSLDIFKSYSEN